MSCSTTATIMAGITAVLVAIALLYSTPRAIPRNELESALTGKVVLVCGASSGIGEQIARDLASLGARVIITARRVEKLEEVKRKIIADVNPEAQIGILKCDFSDVSQSEGVVGEAMKIFGRIDHLIINHGVMKGGPFLSTPGEQTPDSYRHTFQVNFFSFIQIALSAIDHLEASSGQIIVTSSIAGEFPFIVNTIYGASKHAMNGFFYTLNQELILRNSKVRVSVASLGMIKTDAVSKIQQMGIFDHVPENANGNLEDCSMAMIDGLVSRPGTITYPYWSTVMMRGLWQVAPSALLDQQTYEDALILSKNNLL